MCKKTVTGARGTCQQFLTRERQTLWSCPAAPHGGAPDPWGRPVLRAFRAALYPFDIRVRRRRAPGVGPRRRVPADRAGSALPLLRAHAAHRGRGQPRIRYPAGQSRRAPPKLRDPPIRLLYRATLGLRTGAVPDVHEARCDRGRAMRWWRHGMWPGAVAVTWTVLLLALRNGDLKGARSGRTARHPLCADFRADEAIGKDSVHLDAGRMEAELPAAAWPRGRKGEGRPGGSRGALRGGRQKRLLSARPRSRGSSRRPRRSRTRGRPRPRCRPAWR